MKKDEKAKKVKDVKKQKKEKKETNPGFIKQTSEEMKKVSWPTKKDVIKYTLATLIFCLVIVGFFQLLDLGLSFIKGMLS